MDEQAYNDESFYKDDDDDDSYDENLRSVTGDDDLDGSRTDSEATEKQTTGSTPVADAIAQEETAVVFRLKMVVLLVLIVSAVGVAFTVYFYLHKSEEAAFRTEFEDHADKVVQGVGHTIDNLLGSFDSLAVLWVSYARATNQSWPFVTLPDFAVRMSKIVPLSHTLNMNIVPIVTPAQRKKWEAYVLQNDDWVNETITVQRGFKNYFGPDDYDTAPHHIVHGDYSDIPYNVTYVQARQLIAFSPAQQKAHSGLLSSFCPLTGVSTHPLGRTFQ
jgi:hypothetical protein